MKFLNILTLATALYGSSHQILKAQEWGVWYDAEMQTDFKGHCNYVNLFYLSADCPLGEHLTVSAASISILKSLDESLVNDLQTFSNIEADNQPFTLAIAGMSWKPNDKQTLFFGIRNVNEDYFTSDLTSLFLNSSCGIFPTLSCNMDIANYPLASMCLHYNYTSQSLNFLASAYNGQGYYRLTGADNLWRITPRSDGLFFITQADWKKARGNYFFGAAHQSGHICESSDVLDGASSQTVLWTYTEQSLTDHFSLIADYSHTFGRSALCTDFVGLGGQYAQGKSTLGLFSDYAHFRDDDEWATELTYKYDLNSWVFLLASCQLIHHEEWMPVGMLRLSVRL